jgi:hypothetical protein
MVVGVTFVQAGSNPKGKPFVAINDQIVEVKGAVTSLQDQIDLLVTRADSVEERLVATEAAVGSLVVQNAAIQALVDANLANEADIQTEIIFLKQASTDLNNMIVNNVSDIGALEIEVAGTQALISSLEASLIMLDNGVLSLEVSLQEQINNNTELLSSLVQEINMLSAKLEQKQNMINGVCPDGSAVQKILSDGGLVCGEAGGGTSGQLETTFVYTMVNAERNQWIDSIAQCPEGYIVSGPGYNWAAGWTIQASYSGSGNTPNYSRLLARNDNPYSDFIVSVSTCLRIAP